MTGTPKKTKKYLDLIETAQNLFLTHGIRRITVEEICSKAAVSKMTFYKYFANKDAIVLGALNYMIEEAEEKYHMIVNSPIGFDEKIKKIIEMKREQAARISKDFFDDIWAHPTPEITNMVKERSEHSAQLIFDMLREGQESGYINPQLNTKFLIYLMNHLIEMISDPKLHGIYNNHQELTEHLTEFLFYGILGSKS